MAFDELALFAGLKARPGAFFGQPSFRSLLDFLGGVFYGVSECSGRGPCWDSVLPYYDGFTKWYSARFVKEREAYAAWWTHLLYTSGCMDAVAFDRFFRYFEEYLEEVHHITLPEERKEST